MSRGEPSEHGDNGDERNTEESDNSQQARADRPEEGRMLPLYRNL
jgi:hypothetical protein